MRREQAAAEERETYEIRIRCTNCGWTGMAVIPMGRKVEDALGHRRCAGCGCKTLAQRHWGVHL